MTFSIIFFIYSSPIEIVVAAAFLYNILGLSAFAGVVVLIIASPLNTYISKRSYRIQKELLKTRDKRMTVMNELIGGISFIKFFAWTEKWKQRATEARTAELRSLVKCRSFITFAAYTQPTSTASSSRWCGRSCPSWSHFALSFRMCWTLHR